MDFIARNDAKQAGKTRYFTGLPCKHGHVVERFVSSRGCTACAAEHSKAAYHAAPAKFAEKITQRTPEQQAAYRASARAWKAEHKGECSASYKAWVVGNRARRAAATQSWKQVNADRVRAAARAWGATNRWKTNAWAMAHHAAKLQRTPAWADRKAIAGIYQDAAEFRAAGIEVDVDHEIPLQGELVSGLHVHNNLRVCMSSFNRAKSNTFHI